MIAYTAGLTTAIRPILTGSTSKPWARLTFPGTQAAICDHTHIIRGFSNTRDVSSVILSCATSASRLKKPRAKPTHLVSLADSEGVKGVKDA